MLLQINNTENGFQSNKIAFLSCLFIVVVAVLTNQGEKRYPKYSSFTVWSGAEDTGYGRS